MSFEQETGTGSSTSNSYGSVAGAIAYWALRNDTVWAALTTAAQQAAMVKATAFIDAMVEWKGTKASSSQALDWPRNGVYDHDGFLQSSTTIPAKLEHCCYEFAYKARAGDLIETFTKSILEASVDGAVSVKYDQSSPDGTSYEHLWMIIADFTSGSSLMGTTVRS